MSALTVAAALDALLNEAPAWLPPVTSWEVAEDGDHWILSGGIPDSVGSMTAAKALGLVAGEHGVEVNDDGRMMTVLFTWREARVQLYYFRPARWTAPERCATCPTKLGAEGVAYVRLGEGHEAPVVCVACRDRMHAAWLATQRLREQRGCAPYPAEASADALTAMLAPTQALTVDETGGAS
ncbi:hypothetical protein [Streptomyces sp. SGAir0957]